jgi:hypothetical protein
MDIMEGKTQNQFNTKKDVNYVYFSTHKSNLSIKFDNSLTIAQVFPVNQITDVMPTDWAFQRLVNLSENYGIEGLVYPDSTFRGNRGLNRYELILMLKSALDTAIKRKNIVSEIYTLPTKNKIKQLIDLQEALETEVKILEDRFKKLAYHQNLPTFVLGYKKEPYQIISLFNEEINSKKISFTVQNEVLVSQVTSIYQIRDISRSHWAFEDMQSLIEKWGCGATLAYPDGTLRGKRSTTKFEFADALSVCLDTSLSSASTISANIPSQEEVDALLETQKNLGSNINELELRLQKFEEKNK